MSARLHVLAGLLCVFAIGVGFAQAQSIGGSSGGGGVASSLVCLLSGGAGCTMTGPLVINATASSSTEVPITGASGQTGDYLTVQAEDDTIPRFQVKPNGTSGSMMLSFRPVITGAVSSYLSIGTSGTQYIGLSAAGTLSIDNGITFTGNTPIFSALATDITAAAGEDVTIKGGSSTGSVQLQSLDGATDFLLPDGSAGLNLFTANGSGSIGVLRSGTGGGAVRVSTNFASVGSSVDIAADTLAAGMGDTLVPATGVILFGVQGGGLLRDVVVQTVTTADDAAGTKPAVTLTPTSTDLRCACNDATGCTVTLSEIGAADGTWTDITSTGTGNCEFADTAGVTELAGAYVMGGSAGGYDTLTLRYVVDRWVEQHRSNN